MTGRLTETDSQALGACLTTYRARISATPLWVIFAFFGFLSFGMLTDLPLSWGVGIALLILFLFGFVWAVWTGTGRRIELYENGLCWATRLKTRCVPWTRIEAADVVSYANGETGYIRLCIHQEPDLVLPPVGRRTEELLHTLPVARVRSVQWPNGKLRTTGHAPMSQAPRLPEAERVSPPQMRARLLCGKSVVGPATGWDEYYPIPGGAFIITHEWSDWTYAAPDSCRQIRTCLRCGTEAQKEGGHIWSAWEYTAPDACSATRTCSRCGEKEQSMQHVWELVSAEGDGWAGVETYVCQRCHEQDVRYYSI